MLLKALYEILNLIIELKEVNELIFTRGHSSISNFKAMQETKLIKWYKLRKCIWPKSLKVNLFSIAWVRCNDTARHVSLVLPNYGGGSLVG